MDAAVFLGLRNWLPSILYVQNGLIERASPHRATHSDAAHSLDRGRRVVGSRFKERGGARFQRLKQDDQASVDLIFGSKLGCDLSVHVVRPQHATSVLRR